MLEIIGLYRLCSKYMKSIKAKLKVNNKQKTLMAQHASYSRWCYNCQLSWGNAAVQYGYQKIGF